MKILRSLFIPILVLFLVSCRDGTNQHKNNNTIAFIDSIQISYSEVDSKIQQQLYDELNRIYLIRKIALKETIKQKLIEIEASHSNTSVDLLIDSVFKNLSTVLSLQKFKQINGLEKEITEFKQRLIYHDVKSERGQELLSSRYRQALIDLYCDSLRNQYSIKSNLQPPISPKIHLNDIISHSKGNLSSPINILIISDYECSMCRKHKWITDSLYCKYGDKIQFNYTHFGSYVSIAARAAESAGNQGKFWEMHEKLYDSQIIPDSISVYDLANELQLDMEAFHDDFSNPLIQESIYTNLSKIKSAGIYGTPTILINGRPLANSADYEKIEDEIKKLL